MAKLGRAISKALTRVQAVSSKVHQPIEIIDLDSNTDSGNRSSYSPNSNHSETDQCSTQPNSPEFFNTNAAQKADLH